MAFTLIISDGNIFLEAFIAIFLCPLIVLAVVEIPGIENFASAGPIRWLGEISFSIYLWQLPLAILARDIGIERISENKAVVGITYMLALVVISSLSLWYYEMPMRNVINALWASVMRRHRQVR
jgi:peptidoglycan/LPS O-acetylase OafA/YrhL